MTGNGDDDLLSDLPELDGSPEDAAAEGSDEWELLPATAEVSEEVGLDDTTGAAEPIDVSLLDLPPEQESALGPGERAPADLDPVLDLEGATEEGPSWVDAGGREDRWDEPLDIEEVPDSGVDDGGRLGIDDVMGDDGLGEDEVDLPPLVERGDGETGAVGTTLG